MTHVPARDLGLLVAITLIWGLNLVVSKFGLEELPPLVFSALRFAVVAACTFPFLRVIRGRMGAMVVAALLAGGLNFALLFAGLALAENVSAVAIASQLTVPFTTLLSVGLLGETVRWRRWSGIALSFTGVLVNATMDLGQVVLLTASLSFLGLGALPPAPEWGAMITEGAKNFYQWWIALAPGLAMLTVVLGFNFLGDGLRDQLDVKAASR